MSMSSSYWVWRHQRRMEKKHVSLYCCNINTLLYSPCWFIVTLNPLMKKLAMLIREDYVDEAFLEGVGYMKRLRAS